MKEDGQSIKEAKTEQKGWERIIDFYRESNSEYAQRRDKIDLEAKIIKHLQSLYKTPGYYSEIMLEILVFWAILFAFLVGISMGMA